MTKTDRITIRVNPELKRRATEKSERTGRPISHVLIQALQQWVDAKDQATQ